MQAPVATAFPAQLSMSGPSPLDASGWKQPDLSSWSQGTWQVVGEDSQALMVVLKAGERIMTEPGGMLHSAPGLRPKADTGGFGNACKRCCCAGESFIRTHYINETGGDQSISVTPSFPAKIVPVDVSKYSGMVLKKGAFTAALGDQVEFQMECAPTFAVGCCAGQGCCFTSIHGSGMSWVNAGGAVFMKTLADGEQIQVDGPSVVAVEKSVKWEVVRAGDCMMMCCGGNGLFNTLLTGPGLVIMQSMSMERTIKGFMAAAPQ